MISYYSTNSEYEPGGQGVEPAPHLVRRSFMWIMVHKLGPFQANNNENKPYRELSLSTKQSNVSCLY